MLVNHHGLVLWMQAIEEGVLGMVVQVPQSEHVVVKLLELDSQLDYTLIVILGHFPFTLLYRVELAYQCAVHGSSTVHRVKDFHDTME